MSKTDVIEKPLSLAQHFEAPQNYLGVYGWICGYSADAQFMDEATERFTRQTRAQRAYTGKPCLALWLDPGHGALSLLDVRASRTLRLSAEMMRHSTCCMPK